MNKRSGLHLRLLRMVAAVAACPAGAGAAATQDWGFETGALQGWSRSGSAFDSQPTFGNNIEPRRPGERPGQAGDWWIGTFENRPGSAYPAGGTQGDAPVGALLSDPFTLRRAFVHFLIGGGADMNQVRAELLVELRPGEIPPPMRADGVGGMIRLDDGDYTVRVSAAGRDEEAMRRVAWDVRADIGRKARIFIIDNASGPWGHINVDDFQFADAPLATLVAGPPVATVVPGARIAAALPAAPIANVITAVPVTDAVTAVPVGPAGPGAQPPGRIGIFAPGDPPDPSSAARFRLTARGFFVQRQSEDDAFERDGRGDEVYVRSDSFVVGAAGLAAGPSARSETIGDRFLAQGGSSRPQWGSAATEIGGFVTGDDYPTSTPWAPRPGIVRTGELPLAVWEGELIRGGDAVVIVPSIWEWDDHGASFEERQWDLLLGPALEGGLSSLREAIETGRPGSAATPALRDIVSLPIGDQSTRPIGSRASGRGQMQVPVIVLSYDSAAALAGRRFPNARVGVTSDGVEFDHDGPPLPAGVLPVQFHDQDGLNGDYILYLYLERLP
jgi:hypothetical protein